MAFDFGAAGAEPTAADPAVLAAPPLTPAPASIWQDAVGDGFKAGTQSLGLGLGAGYGLRILGSKQHHDLALGDLAYGWMAGAVRGRGHWYEGNWELRGDLFGGEEFSPTTDYVIGIAPHLRYNFMTGTRWVPYVDAGAGVTATDISAPDLSHTFEFNLQAATGVRWFVSDRVALGIEARYLHLSCAGMNTPNLGLNNVGGSLTVTWFF
jgi:opacity protein-like surface antigen